MTGKRRNKNEKREDLGLKGTKKEERFIRIKINESNNLRSFLKINYGITNIYTTKFYFSNK